MLPINRQIVIENNILEQVDNTKFLGVYIEDFTVADAILVVGQIRPNLQ